MQPFRSYTFTWLEIGIFKVAMLAIGLALGAYFHEIVQAYIIGVIVIAIVASAYVGYIGLRQAAETA